jgi:uncharacterized protein YneF (UPF0154 family)
MLPPATHLLYIPGVLLVGLFLGFFLGAKAARAQFEKAARDRKK